LSQNVYLHGVGYWLLNVVLAGLINTRTLWNAPAWPRIFLDYVSINGQNMVMLLLSVLSLFCLSAW